MFTMPRTNTMAEHTVAPLAYERDESSSVIMEEGEGNDPSQANRPNTAERQRKEDQERELVLRDHTGSVESLKFFVSSYGRLRLSSGSLDTTIRIWNPLSEHAAESPPISILEGHSASVMAIDAFSVSSSSPPAHTPQPTTTATKPAQGKTSSEAGKSSIVRLVSGSEDGTLRVWDPEGLSGQECVAILAGHQSSVFGVACFRDENGWQRVASVSEDTNVLIWDPLLTGLVQQPLLVLEGHSSWVCDIAAFDSYISNPEGGELLRRPRLVTGSMDMTVRVWDPAGGRLAVCKGHRSWVNAVAAFVDAKSSEQRIASASSDHTVRIWDPLRGGGALAVIDAHSSHIWCLASFADRKGLPRLVSGSQDHTVKCWDPGTRKLLPLYTCYGKGVGCHSKSVKCAAVFVLAGSAGGKISASGGEDNAVRCWDPSRLGKTAGSTVVPAPLRMPVPEPESTPKASPKKAAVVDRSSSSSQRSNNHANSGAKSAGKGSSGASANVTLPPVTKAST